MAVSLSFRELSVKVGYGQIACKVWGENAGITEKFLAVHGWQDNAGSFDPMMKHFLTKDRCVICMDLPGHGLSSHYPKGIPYSPAGDIQSIRSVVRHLGWSRYNLIGHSMGAMRLGGYALCWPEEIKSIINIDGVVIPFTTADQNPYADFGRQIDKFLRYENEYHGVAREHTWAELSERWFTAVPDLKPDDFTVLMKRGCRQLDNGKYVYTRDAALNNRTNIVLQQAPPTFNRCLSKLKDIPQLLLCLQLLSDEKFRQQSSVMAEILPNTLDIVSLEGEAHHFHMQKPEEVVKLVNDFLSKHQIEKRTAV